MSPKNGFFYRFHFISFEIFVSPQWKGIFLQICHSWLLSSATNKKTIIYASECWLQYFVFNLEKIDNFFSAAVTSSQLRDVC